MIPCFSKVSIVVKSAACFLRFYARGGALFRATLHSRSFTVRWNSGILAGAVGNSFLKISLNSLHNVRNRCCRSLSPDIWISDKTSVVDGDGNHGLNVSVLSRSISSSSGAEPPRMCWASTVSEASKLRMTGFRGFATRVKGTSEGQSHGSVVHLACWIGVEMGSLTPSWLGTFEKRLNFFIESLPMIRSRMWALG